MIHLYPTLSSDLACPSRFARSRLQRELTLAPFARSAFGRLVHERIAASLRAGAPISFAPLPLPSRVLLNEGDDVLSLEARAFACLERFASHVAPALRELGEVVAVERRVTLEDNAGAWRLTGVLDAVLRRETRLSAVPPLHSTPS